MGNQIHHWRFFPLTHQRGLLHPAIERLPCRHAAARAGARTGRAGIAGHHAHTATSPSAHTSRACGFATAAARAVGSTRARSLRGNIARAVSSLHARAAIRLSGGVVVRPGGGGTDLGVTATHMEHRHGGQEEND